MANSFHWRYTVGIRTAFLSTTKLMAPGSTPKSNTGDMSIWDDPNLLNILNPDYVFVGLNGSGKHDGYLALNRPWFNFHSDSPHQQDYKLRYALMDTPLWGSYITDIIKEYQEVDSAKVKAYLKTHPEVVEKNILLFRQEMKLHGGHPVPCFLLPVQACQP